jgi:hypothetical protein
MIEGKVVRHMSERYVLSAPFEIFDFAAASERVASSDYSYALAVHRLGQAPINEEICPILGRTMMIV